jgi:ubiquitin C
MGGFLSAPYSYGNATAGRGEGRVQFNTIKRSESGNTSRMASTWTGYWGGGEQTRYGSLSPGTASWGSSPYSSRYGDEHAVAGSHREEVRRLGGGGIFVKVGLSGKTITIYDGNELTVDGLKAAIQDREGIPPDQQRILFAGRQLEGDYTLDRYGVMRGDTIWCAIRLRGGARGATRTRGRRTRRNATSRNVLDCAPS